MLKLKERNVRAHQQGYKKVKKIELKEFGQENAGKIYAYTNETEVAVDPGRYITPPIVRPATRPDQLREPALDDLAPITTGDYRPVPTTAQPAPANTQVTYTVIDITK